MARSTMRAWGFSKPPVSLTLFMRVKKMSYSSRLVSTSRCSSCSWNSLRLKSCTSVLLASQVACSCCSLRRAISYSRLMPLTTLRTSLASSSSAVLRSERAAIIFGCLGP